MTLFGACHRCGRLWGFRSEHLARQGELADDGGAPGLNPAGCGLTACVIAKYFADVARQRALQANNSD